MKDYSKIDGLVDNSKLLLEVAYDRGYDKGWHMAIKALEQEPKTGHWIKQSENVNRCSECELMVIKTSINNYCPNCGAKMVET